MRVPRSRPSLQKVCVIQDFLGDDDTFPKLKPIQLFQTLLEAPASNENEEIEIDAPKRKKKAVKSQENEISDEAKKEEEEIKKLQKYYEEFDDFELAFEVKTEQSGSIRQATVDEPTFSQSQLRQVSLHKTLSDEHNNSQKGAEVENDFNLEGPCSCDRSILQESTLPNIFEERDSLQFFDPSFVQKELTFNAINERTENLPCEKSEEKENSHTKGTLETLLAYTQQKEESPTVEIRSSGRLSALTFSPIGALSPARHPETNYFTSTPVRKEALVPETPGSVTIDDRNTTRNTTRIISFYDANVSHHFNKLPFYLEGYDGEHENYFDQLLFVVQQHASIDWRELNLKTPKKLGEGVYGEVYSCKYGGQLSAVKIIPFNNDIYRYEGKVNGEQLWEPQEILPEVLMTRELSYLNSNEALNSTPNFIKLLGAHVVKGAYPKALLKAWDVFDRERKSENDRPSEYSSPNQHFIAICLSMGGTDLENSQLENEAQCVSLLLQVALSLLIAEEVLEFEHRDLHCGNVLVEPFKGNISYRYRGQNVSLASHGIKVNIIDFTLSRLKKGGTALMRDLENDEELFQGTGDYQMDIYKMMRKENGRDWLSFTRKTNVFWLHYLADYLIMRKKCKKPITKKRQKILMETMDNILKKDGLNDFLSGAEFAQLISPFIIIDE